MNIAGLIFVTWISGEVAVIIFDLGSRAGRYQEEIDGMNATMIHQQLSRGLQEELRGYLLRVQGTMAQQQELDDFVRTISSPLRIAVQRELFTSVLQQKNGTIRDVQNLIARESDNHENV